MTIYLLIFFNRGEHSDSLTNAAFDSIHQELLNHKDTLRILVDDVDGIKRLISGKSIRAFESRYGDEMILKGDSKNENLPPEVRINQLENKVTDFLDQLNSLDHMFCRRVELLQKRIIDLEKDAGEIVEKVNLR